MGNVVVASVKAISSSTTCSANRSTRFRTMGMRDILFQWSFRTTTPTTTVMSQFHSTVIVVVVSVATCQQKFVIQNLNTRQSVVRLDDNQLADQVGRERIGAGRKGNVLPLLDRLAQLRLRRVVAEGKAARKHRVQHAAQAPHVGLEAVVARGGRVGRLGRRVLHRADESVRVLLRRGHVAAVVEAAHAEVGKLDVVVRRQEDVLGLQVAVRDAGHVAREQAPHELAEEAPHLGDRQAVAVVVRGDVLVQVAAERGLHDDVVVVGREEQLAVLDDVLVLDLGQGAHLALQVLLVVLVASLDDLCGVRLARRDVPAHSDGGCCTLAKLAP